MNREKQLATTLWRVVFTLMTEDRDDEWFFTRPTENGGREFHYGVYSEQLPATALFFPTRAEAMADYWLIANAKRLGDLRAVHIPLTEAPHEA